MRKYCTCLGTNLHPPLVCNYVGIVHSVGPFFKTAVWMTFTCKIITDCYRNVLKNFTEGVTPSIYLSGYLSTKTFSIIFWANCVPRLRLGTEQNIVNSLSYFGNSYFGICDFHESEKNYQQNIEILYQTICVLVRCFFFRTGQ